MPRARARARAPTRIRCFTSGPSSRAARERQPDLPTHLPPPADRPDARRRCGAFAADAAPRWPARGRTGRATTSARSTGPPRRGCRPRAAPTSSSSASATPTRRRASSSSPTAAPSSPSSRRRCPGSTRPRRCGARPTSSSRAPPQAGGFVGYLDYARRRAVLAAAARRAPARLPARGTLRGRGRWGAPADGVERSLEHLFEHRRNVTAGQLRLRPLGLPRPALARDVADSRRAPLGRHTGCDPGSGLGAELSRRQRDRRPAARSRAAAGSRTSA